MTLDFSSSFGAIRIPTEEFFPVISMVTAGQSCQKYSDDIICECSTSDSINNEIWPILNFTIGAIEFNHSIGIEGQYYLKKLP